MTGLLDLSRTNDRSPKFRVELMTGHLISSRTNDRSLNFE